MRKIAVFSLVSSLVLLAIPGFASTATVSITGSPSSATCCFAFSPQVVKVAMGNAVDWNNSTAYTHTSTQDQAIWNISSIAAGNTSASVALRWAASYSYHCNFHPYMVGTVKVPIQITSTSSTSFTITYASASMPSAFTATVQEKIGSGSWTNYRTGLTGTSTTFSTTTPGTYSFRSLLVSSTRKTKPSPAKSVTI